MNKRYLGVIMVCIVLLLIGTLLFITTSSPKEDTLSKEYNFSKKQECSKYYELANTKIQESGRVFQKDTYTLNEVFYSPKMNTCLYAYTIHTTFDPKEIYTIDDIFGGGVFVGGLSKTAEQDYEQKIMELKQ